MKNLKRLILLSLIFISTIAFGQKVGMTVAKYKEVTTAQKNAFTVPAGENWRVYDTDTGRNEYWDGDSWEPLDTNTLTALSTGTVTATTYGITSDGSADDIVLPEANTTQAGLLGADKWDEIVANTSKVTNVSTNLSEGTATNTTVDVNSSDGTNATLVAASTSRAGVMTKAKFDEVVVNNAKTSNATHTGEVTGATALTLDATAISNKTLDIALLGTEHVLIDDSGLKKTTLQAIADLSGVGANGILQKNLSWGESYIINWRDLVLDDGATYFPNNGGYEIGRLHQAEINTSLHFIPAAVGEGVIYAIGKNRVNDLDVDRAALATYIDEDRILRTAAFDVARIDYTDGDGAILAEDESINLIERSETFDHASGYWTLNGVTLTSGFSAPDDSLNAYKLVEDTSTTLHEEWVNIAGTTSSVNHAYSIFAKKGERDKVYVGDGSSGSNESYFDLTNGILLFEGVNTNGSFIKELADGWYKITCIYDRASTSKPFTFGILQDSYTSGVRTAYTGDGTSGVYIFGAQLEELAYPTSYIQSDSGSSTTRLADVITGAGDVNTFSSVNDRGVLFIEVSSEDDGFNLIGVSDGSTSNHAYIYLNDNKNSIRSSINAGSEIVATIDATLNHKCAIRWDGADYSFYVDGVLIGSNTATTIIGLNELRFSNPSASSNRFFGKIEQIMILPYLTDEEMILLTKMFGFMFLCRIRRKETEYKIAA